MTGVLDLPSIATDVIADLSFFDKAPCSTVNNVEDFFPDSHKQSKKIEAIQRAKAVCDGCSVRSLCLEWALVHQPQEGIWGGKTAAELKDIA